MVFRFQACAGLMSIDIDAPHLGAARKRLVAKISEARLGLSPADFSLCGSRP